MPSLNDTIEKRLTMSQVAIDNALADKNLQAQLSEYGYTIAKLREGRLLREIALALHQQQRAAYGDMFAATDALNNAQAEAQTEYMRYVKVARVALQNDRGALQKLDLAKERKRTLAGWLLQAQQFYANALANPSILDTLAQYGITQDKLEAGKVRVEAVSNSTVVQRSHKGTAQDATKKRDEAIRALDKWMSSFVKIARVALDDEPQLLEKLGVAVRA